MLKFIEVSHVKIGLLYIKLWYLEVSTEVMESWSSTSYGILKSILGSHSETQVMESENDI